METRLEKLQRVWQLDRNKSSKEYERNVPFDDLIASIVSVGPFYAYIVDFSDYSLSHVTPSIEHILGLDPKTASFNDVVESFHPDDMEYIQKAERYTAEYFFKNVPPSKLTQYKSSFNFRIRLKDGSYGLFNHQALMVVLGEDGGYGKALNIHTRIDHLTEVNNHRFSLIGLLDQPSFLNLSIEEVFDKTRGLSKKEKEILGFLSKGMDSNEIAKKLFISPYTVKKHRANILRKANCKNTAQLIQVYTQQGLI